MPAHKKPDEHVLSVLIPNDVLRRLREAAARDGSTTISPVVRRYVVRGLAQEERRVAQQAVAER